VRAEGWAFRAQIGALLIAGALSVWWTAARADRGMRVEMLQQTRLVAQAVNLGRVKVLTGTKADLDSPDYLRLKEQLSLAKQADQKYRFTCLLGRNVAGAVFIFVDSEPAGSKDYSPPGQVYSEASEGFRRIFDTKTEAAEGPVTDRWGTWVAALIPLSDPQSGEILAVLGIAIDARAWKSGVAARAALPVGLMLALLLGVAAALAYARRADASATPVLRRLLPPLAAMLILLMLGAGALLWQQQRQRQAEETAAQMATTTRELRLDLDNQAAGMAAALQPIAANPGVQQALRQGDATGLLAAWRPVFETLRRDYKITHFEFLAADRVCLLRVHKPELHGDRNERFTTLEAESTGRTASGIELGQTANFQETTSFTLRVVQPVIAHGVVLGYVTLGKEIEDVLQARRAHGGLELAVTIHKKYLNRQAWEEGMHRLGRKADWGGLPRSIVSYASQGRLPDAFASWANPATGEPAHGETEREIASDGRDWRVSAIPLQDASGTDVGDLLIMRDVSAEKAAFARLLALGGTTGAVLLTVLLGFIFVLLRRTDAGIRAQQAQLRESEEHLSATLRSIGDGVIACDAEHKVVSLNGVAETLTGWTTAEAQGRAVEEIFHILHAKTRAWAENPVERALREGVVVELANHTALIARDGTERQIADSCAPIRGAAGGIIGAVLVFRDVTGEYRRREQLRESEARFDQLAAQSGTIAWEVDAQGLYTYVSHVAETVWGYRPDELVGRMHFYDLHPEEGREAFKTGAFAVFERKEPFQNFVNAVQAKDGRQVWVSTNGMPLLNTDGTLRGYRGSDIDITESRRAERYQYLSAEILSALNEPVGVLDVVNRILAAIQRETGFDAVGIRLRSGDDFPYFVQNGFSPEFLLTENTLIARDRNGGPCRDKNGNISLECTCGLVLSGQTDPANPLFTKDGSWWTNNSLLLLDLPANQDRRLHPRNRCIHQGYCSVALIPIRANRDIVGLLQLNDRKKDRFTLEQIHFLEGISASIGVALMRKKQEDALRESETRHRLLFDGSRDALLTLVPPSWKFTSGNPAACKMFGAKDASELTALGPWNVSPERQPDGSPSADKAREAIEEALREGYHFFEWTHRRLDGEDFPATVLLTRIEMAGQAFLQSTVRDITAQKQAEAALKESEANISLLIEHSVSAIAVHEIVLDAAGRPVDYIFLSANPAFETHTGLCVADVLGRRATAVLPGIEKTSFMEIYGKVALTGEPVSFEEYSEALARHFHINAYKVGEGRFAVVFTDITERKRAEERTEKALVRQRSVSRLRQSLLATAPLDDKLREVADAIVGLFGADFCRIWLIRPGDLCERGCLHAEVRDGPSVCQRRDRCLHLLTSAGRYTHIDGRAHRRVPIGCYKVGRVAAGEDPRFVTNDVQNDPLVQDHAWAHELGLVSFAGYQLRTPEGETLGILALFAKHPILADEDAVLDGLGSTVALVVQQAVAEEALRVGEARLRGITDSAQDAILMVDPRGAITYWNPAAESILGYRGEEAIGEDLHKLLVPERFHEAHRAAFPEFLRTGRGNVIGKTVELAARRKDGREIAVDLSLSAICLNGEWHAVGIIRDITERKRAEEELRAKEHLLSESQSIAHIGSWSWDLASGTSVLQWSPETYRLHGVSPDTFVPSGETLPSLIHQDDRASMQAWLGACLAGEAPPALEFRALLPDGGIRYVYAHGSLVRDAENKPIRMVGIAQDITERKLAEAELREERRKKEAVLADLFENAPVGYRELDKDGVVRRVNAAQCALLGYHADEILGRSVWDAVAEADREVSREAFRRKLSGEQPLTPVRRRYVRRDGAEMLLEIHDRLVRSETGEVQGMRSALLDVTEAAQAEERIARYLLELEAAGEGQEKHAAELARMVEELGLEKERAEAATRAKSEFLANMSHEIRTPMNGVIGMTGLLLDTELNDEQRRYGEIVRASGESLLGVINAVLDFSKIEAGKLDLETLDFDLQGLLDDFAATLAVQAHQKGLELFSSADPAVPTLLRGDPGRLRQILTNLAGNAVKFTQKGEVAVRASLVEESETECLLRFSVRDTGIGIPADKIRLLFAKFSQVDASTTRKYGGTGLGLAISKQLAEMMGGEVGVESAAGQGSEFWFTVRLGKQPEGARTQICLRVDLRGVRALIVDDNATSREILTTRMTFWGMRPSEAEDGPGALQALYRALEEGDPFRVAVIDMRTPGMDGETMGRTIQADERLAGTRMVMLTSIGFRGDARYFEEIGFAAYATKPIRPVELMGMLSLALTERSGTGPEARSIATRHSAREKLNPFAGRNARILLVEDNITNQQVALGILKKFGLRADAVADGAEAVKALESIPYDLVLMDVQMPVMDGLEATRQIRSPESGVPNHDVPVIAMTAHALQGDRERCIEAGMNDYVSKPVSPRTLAEVLARWLPEKKDELEVPDAEETPPPVLPSSAPLVFDRAGMLERLMDDEDLVRVVTESFLDDVPRQIEALRRYLDAWDAPGAERQAHSIKGASSNVGGEALRALAFEMEKAGKAGDLGSVAARMDDLEHEFVRLKEAMVNEP
jgi:PAS domain S-box-containing protein